MKVKTKPLIVKQIEEAPVATEILAESIVTISRGVKKLLAGPLSTDALVLLIQEAAGGRGRISQEDIRTVMAGMSQLEERFIRKPKRG